MHELAKKWVGERCKLDGKPAIIAGRQNDFATIAQLPNGLHLEWSWEAVDRIMSTTRMFYS